MTNCATRFYREPCLSGNAVRPFEFHLLCRFIINFSGKVFFFFFLNNLWGAMTCILNSGNIEYFRVCIRSGPEQMLVFFHLLGDMNPTLVL